MEIANEQEHLYRAQRNIRFAWTHEKLMDSPHVAQAGRFRPRSPHMVALYALISGWSPPFPPYLGLPLISH